MPKHGPHRQKRVPKLSFTEVQNIGWHVTFRDAAGVPRRHRFGLREKNGEAQARLLYHAWVLEHLGGENPSAYPTQKKSEPKQKQSSNTLSGSIVEIASGFIESERSRITRVNLLCRNRFRSTDLFPLEPAGGLDVVSEFDC